MNLLLREPGEIAGNETVLTGRRAEHLLRVLGVVPGDTVRVGVVGGRLGSGAASTGAVATCSSATCATMAADPSTLPRAMCSS